MTTLWAAVWHDDEGYDSSSHESEEDAYREVWADRAAADPTLLAQLAADHGIDLNLNESLLEGLDAGVDEAVTALAEVPLTVGQMEAVLDEIPGDFNYTVDRLDLPD